jgi:hypothetical protein
LREVQDDTFFACDALKAISFPPELERLSQYWMDSRSFSLTAINRVTFESAESFEKILAESPMALRVKVIEVFGWDSPVPIPGYEVRVSAASGKARIFCLGFPQAQGAEAEGDGHRAEAKGEQFSGSDDDDYQLVT